MWVCVVVGLAAGERLAVVPWRRAAKSILMKFHAYFVFIHFLWFYYVLPFSFHRFDVIRFARKAATAFSILHMFVISSFRRARFHYYYHRRRSRSTSTEWNIIFHTRYVTSTCVCESCALYYGLRAATAQEPLSAYSVCWQQTTTAPPPPEQRNDGEGWKKRKKWESTRVEYIHDDMVK